MWVCFVKVSKYIVTYIKHNVPGRIIGDVKQEFTKTILIEEKDERIIWTSIGENLNLL